MEKLKWVGVQTTPDENRLLLLFSIGWSPEQIVVGLIGVRFLIQRRSLYDYSIAIVLLLTLALWGTVAAYLC